MSKKLIQAAAGAGEESVYVDDVFSTYLYDGNGSTQTITNGIDLSGEGGLVWSKWRSGYYTSRDHNLFDTERGTTAYLNTNNTSAEKTPYSNAITYNSNGFTWNQQFPSNMSFGGETFVSWTFRKQAGFFDIITWSGDGTTGRAIPHNLGSTPGCVIVKAYNQTQNWGVLARKSDGTWAYGGATYAFGLNTNEPALSQSSISTDATNFYPEDLRTGVNWNASGYNYIAYLFAHDDQSFGDNGDESIIKCGSYTGNGSSQDINLGFEPQWLMIKKSSAAGSWQIIDTMRGMPVDAGSTKYLLADSSGAEYGSGAEYQAQPTATGFKLGLSNDVNQSGVTFIYIAIRRPMKTPEAGTEVFSVDTYNQTSASDPAFNLGAVVDFGLRRLNNFESNWTAQTRLTGDKGLTPNATDAESTQNYGNWDNMVGWYQGASITPPYSQANWYGWSFKRATGFFDVVAYEGNGSPSNTVRRDLKHNLGVTPELAILKRRDSTSEWQVGVNGTSLYLNLTNSSAGTYTHSSYFNATDFDVEGWVTEANNNVSGSDYIVYLFATLAGISKVGSYTGTAANLDVDCGFTAGARFILIKRTDSTGDWYVYDSERGIVAGNDPYILLNSTAAEVTSTDYIDPLSSGFTVTSSAPAGLNASGGSYIFLAIA